MVQEHISRKPRDKDSGDQTQESVAKSFDKAAQTSEVDDLLDDIDSVLEENAEEFVASFVQKGGE